jgi:hypothetical protein
MFVEPVPLVPAGNVIHAFVLPTVQLHPMSEVTVTALVSERPE